LANQADALNDALTGDLSGDPSIYSGALSIPPAGDHCERRTSEGARL
jgi:hypothetical protein